MSSARYHNKQPPSSALSRASQSHEGPVTPTVRAPSRSCTTASNSRLTSPYAALTSSSPRSQSRNTNGTHARKAPYPTAHSPYTSRHISAVRSTQRQPSPKRSQETFVSENDVRPRVDDETTSDVEADALNEVIMAVDMKNNGDLGCAYYVAAEEVLYLLEDVAMAGTDLVETLLLHAHPTTILLSARAPEVLVQSLERGSDGTDAGKGFYPLPINLNSADFQHDSARDRLSKLEIEQLNRQSMHYSIVVDDDENMLGDAGSGSRQGQMLRLGASINMECQLTIGCAGAVLTDLQRRRSTQYLPDDPDALCAFHIRKIEMFSLFNSMFVNADTIMALQIMQPEFHPNSHQRGLGASSSGCKESLSVYGLFHRHARTKQGRDKLRQLFLRPSLDIDLIKCRQHTIAFFSLPSNADLVGAVSKALAKVANMKNCVAMLRRGVDYQGRKVSIHNNVWATLQKFSAYTLQIRELLKGMPEAGKILVCNKVIGIIDSHKIHGIGERITQTIDFEQSEERGRTAVRSGVDADLDELKRSYDGMEDFLTAVLGSLRQQLPEWARKYIQNCSFLPQLGFLTVVALEQKTGRGCYDGEGSDGQWECMFAADGCVYYKNQQMREMDAQFGDAYCMIIDREIEIVHSLGVSILEHEDTLLAASEVLGELDSMLALSLGCCQHNWNRPHVINENIIEIQGGRHPLQELVVPSFIPNDCYLAGGSERSLSCLPDQLGLHRAGSTTTIEDDDVKHPSTLVLTGPNHSGKSVYLKQVALIVYLAHLGCFVPAEKATIGITDRILTRVATRESVGRNESAFSIDLRQVAFSINFATPRSLILVDEFGKGTDSLGGVGLMTALLDHFTSMGEGRPKVLAATHFHEIFEGDFLPAYPNLSFAHMDILLDLDALVTEEQVTYLFKLVSGRSTSSFGSRCAAMNGISEDIVARAEELVLLQARNEDLELACSVLSDDESCKLQQAELVARRFLEQDYSPVAWVAGARSTRTRNQYRDMLKQIFEMEVAGSVTTNAE
ncbi:muts domain V-domain-containing protein [Microdochium bolleyi]|uniref:DNA mismatch repair protein MSH5 n=1 Tax=Microdochium bolleyi TaxID=196109 RepID=A0A136ITN3_9PEZI|nr:muts domain V-domain-containing protein [Microdochium bolleyi]